MFDILLELIKLLFGGLNVQRCFCTRFELSKDLLDFAGIKNVLSLAGIKDLLSFVGIKDLLSFVGIKDLPGFVGIRDFLGFAGIMELFHFAKPVGGAKELVHFVNLRHMILLSSCCKII